MTEATTNESSGKNGPRPLSTWLLRLAIFSALASVGAALSLAGCGGSDEDVPVLTDDAATEGEYALHEPAISTSGAA